MFASGEVQDWVKASHHDEFKMLNDEDQKNNITDGTALTESIENAC
jgi:hypothetical protein